MTGRNLFDKIAAGWQVKVLCFVAALLLYVGHTFTRMEKKTFIVGLDVVSHGTVSPTSRAPEFVKITIRSKSENVADVLTSDLSATLDLTYLTSEGEYLMPVTVHLSPKVLLMDSFEVRIKPERVPIRVENKMVKYVEVKPALVGDVAHGYAITEVTTEPDFVQVLGPRSAVDGLDSISTDMVDVTDLTYAEDYEVEMQEVNALVTVKKSFDKCAVHVNVEPADMTRTFLAVPVKVVFLNASLEVAADILPITFDVEGTVPSLENFSIGEKSVTVDCSAIKAAGSYNLPVKISLPYPLKVLRRSADTVRIVVREKTVRVDTAAGAAEGAA